MMTRKFKTLVFDSWSILSYFEDEPAGQQIAELIADAHETGRSLMISAINAGEIWYITARQASENEADHIINELEQLGFSIVDADWKLTREAARFKAKVKMSYADCFASALAKTNNAVLITGDPEFKQLEKDIKIHFL